MKRRKSHKGLIAVIGSLSALTLVSVGFASWVITETDTEVINGEIGVDTVEDHRYLISSISPSSATRIVFGHPNASDSDGWLTNTDANTQANLVATYTVTVANAYANRPTQEAPTTPNYVQVGKLTASLAATGSTDNENHALAEGYYKAYYANYVAALPTPSVSLTSQDGTSAIYTVTITFAWGSYFGNDNPYTFYSGKTGNAYVPLADQAVHGTGTWADDAKDALTKLEAAMSGVGYVLTLQTSNL